MYEALNIEFNSEHRLVISRPHGVVDDCSAMELLNFLLALEGVAEPFNRVADLTPATDISLSSPAFSGTRRPGSRISLTSNHVAPPSSGPVPIPKRQAIFMQRS